MIIGALLLVACVQGAATNTATSSENMPTCSASRIHATTQQKPTFVPAETLSPIAAPTPTVRPTAKPTATRVPQPTAQPDDLLHLAGARVNRPEGFEAEVWLEGIRFPTALLDTDSAGHENDRA